MFYYAKLNQSSICVEIVTSNLNHDKRDDLIRLQDYVPSVLNRKWLGDQWSQETFEDVTEIERLRNNVEYLNAENAELKLALAELAESYELEKTEMQLAIVELAELVGGEING